MGCGAIAIALAVNLSGARVIATDISPAALKLASENVSRHGVEDRVTLLEGDLLQNGLRANRHPGLEPALHTLDTTRHPSQRDTGPRAPSRPGRRRERRWTVIEQLIRQAKDKLKPGGAMFVEIGWDLGERALARSLELWPESEVSITPDLAGLDRVLTLRSPIGAAQPA